MGGLFGLNEDQRAAMIHWGLKCGAKIFWLLRTGPHTDGTMKSFVFEQD